MKKILKTAILIITVTVFLFGNAFSAYAVSNDYYLSAEKAYLSVGGDVAFENACTSGADWFITAFSRLESISAEQKQKLLDKANNFFGGNVKINDALRVMIMLSSTGLNINNIVGKNLPNEYIFQNSSFISGGINTLAFGLIAIDGANAKEQKNALVTRQQIINRIISFQLDSGGFAISGKSPDPDVSAMVLTALAPYYKTNDNAAKCINKALDYLSLAQNGNGAFKSYGILNCESTAQVIIALCSLGINPLKDASFIKNGKTTVDGLDLFLKDDGSFSHTKGGESNGLASAEGMCALTALYRYKTDKSPLYSFNSSAVTSFLRRNFENDGAASKIGNLSSNSPSDDSEKINNNSGQSIPQSDNESIEKDENIYNEENNSGNAIVSENISPNSELQKTEHGGKFYKNTAITIIISVALIFIITAVVMFAFKKKRLFARFLSVTAILLVLAIILCFSNVQTVSEYYSEKNIKGTLNVTITVEFTSAIKENKLPKRLANSVPNDGYFMEKKSFTVNDGYTVFDLLITSAKENTLSVDYNGTVSKYIRAIGGLYEFDCGELSGWMFTVNGKFVQSSCDGVELKNGDSVCWSYTTDIGNDIGRAENE